MLIFDAFSLHGVANFAVVNTDIQNYLRPIMLSLVGLAGAVSTLFIMVGGFMYITSSGRPDRLERAKRVLKNALIGLVLVIAAGTLTAILTGAYRDAGSAGIENVPRLTPVEASSDGGGITEVLINSIIGLFKHIIETAGAPFIGALEYFTRSTPLMAENGAVFRLWLTVLGIANALFVLAITLIGFQVMGSSALGFDDMDIKQLLPKFGVTFIVMNMSIFAIDAIISLSNAMIDAVRNSFASLSVWDALSSVAEGSGAQGFVSLLIMIVFLVLAVILLIYYIMRIVTLYIGAVVSPLVALLQVVPGFKDFTITATKAYVANIFVLFIHALILMLAATLFEGLRLKGQGISYDPVMAMLVGSAALLTLLKTQGAMMQMSYVSVGPRALRKMSNEFMNGISYTSSRFRGSRSSKAPRPATSSRNRTVIKAKEGYK